jgi:hypothetical protein
MSVQENQEPVPKIYGAIRGVMEELMAKGIAKTKENKYDRYLFRSIDDVYNALAPALVHNHLVIVPKVLSRTSEERESANGGSMRYVVLNIEFSLTSVEDGSTVSAIIDGEAMDRSDKATNKALSAGYKYMAFSVFCIPTEEQGEDADGDSPEFPSEKERRPPPLSREQVSKLSAALDACESIEELKKLWKDAYVRTREDSKARSELKKVKDRRKKIIETTSKGKTDEDKTPSQQAQQGAD